MFVVLNLFVVEKLGYSRKNHCPFGFGRNPKEYPNIK
jgi:hypothetical protein